MDDMSSLVAVRAGQSGTLPGIGQFELAGVELPPGRPKSNPERPHFWRSDMPLEDAGRVATTLASVFGRTGLWPLVWMWSNDDPPENYYEGPPDLRYLEAFSAEEVLRGGWPGVEIAKRQLGGFPGLAAPAGGRAPGQPIRAPFEGLDERVADPFDGRGGFVLLLVPCRRPAEAIAALGWNHSFIPLPMTAAVMRSWEDRFGVVPVAVEPSSILLSVDAPVTDVSQATVLAGEIIAVTDAIDERHDHPSGWSEMADCLLGTRAHIHHSPAVGLEPSHWRLSFSEDAGLLEDLARSRMGDDLDAYWDA